MEQHCPTIGQLDKAQFDHLIVEHSAGQPSDSAFTNHWTLGHSTVQTLESLTQHYPTFGKLNTGLSNHWTVGKSTVRTQHCPNIGQFDKKLSDNYPTIGMLDTALSKCLHN